MYFRINFNHTIYKSLLVSVNNKEEAKNAASNLRLEIIDIQEISKYEFLGYGIWPKNIPLCNQTTEMLIVSGYTDEKMD
jgi:hypothetical protein